MLCFVTAKSLLEGKELFTKIPVNQAATELSSKHFNSDEFKATWIPLKVKTLIIAGSSDHITPLNLFKRDETYQRANILMKEIPKAGHYPWFENPNEVLQTFQDFVIRSFKSGLKGV